MIPKECKRLIEVDFPIAEVSKQSAREKSIRHGHPSTLHLWWARRPLASSRAILLGLIFPDPCDPYCPEEFQDNAREAMSGLPIAVGEDDAGLRQSLLDFIAIFSDWDRSSEPIWVEASRKLVKAAYPEETPLVVDPFAGGGSIPLEALRIGCDTFASDLNPVACLIMKTLFEDIPRYGPDFADEVHNAGIELIEQVKTELIKYYPNDPDGITPLAYLWARTVRCESPNCGAEIPLMRSFWLSKKKGKFKALKYKVDKNGTIPKVEFELFEPRLNDEVHKATVNRANATCLVCGNVTLPDRVRSQLAKQTGGANVVFDKSGNRISGARMLAVVTIKKGVSGRDYRLPVNMDYQVVWTAQNVCKALPKGAIPNEPTPKGGGSGAGRAFSVQNYGMLKWGNLFTYRQIILMNTIVEKVKSLKKPEPYQRLLACLVSRSADKYASLVVWNNVGEKVEHVFGRQALPIVWDFCEANPFSNATGSIKNNLEWIVRVIDRWAKAKSHQGQVQIADACDAPLPDESCDIWFTDPPYYDAIPYSDLSDLFFIWLKRTITDNTVLKDPFDATNNLTPKHAEIVQDDARSINGGVKDKKFFEDEMGIAFKEGRRLLVENGVASVVFAHKSTEGWEALLSGMLNGGWTITASWPITTEMPARLRARESAALSASVHLVCRPRPEDAPIGEWEDILRQLPKRMKEWVIRLDKEGIHGADLVFSCIGPALELFSKYRKVETAEGEQVKLGPDDEANGEAAKRGYLSYIWEVVGRTALELVLSGDDEGIGTLEEDARLCALFLWTHQSTETQNEKKENDDVPKITGLSLPFDIVRRFAQPLGIHLPDWEDRVIKIEKGMVKMIPVMKRAKQLFGEDITVVASQFELQAKEDSQIELSLALETGEAPEIGGKHRGGAIVGEEFEKANTATTLDRVHAAMLLQAAGKTNALRALIKQEVDRGSEFLRLANSLSALFPTGIEEKRLLDAMLLAVPR